MFDSDDFDIVFPEVVWNVEAAFGPPMRDAMMEGSTGLRASSNRTQSCLLFANATSCRYEKEYRCDSPFASTH